MSADLAAACVYIARGDDPALVKIGWSRNLQRRLDAVRKQIGTPTVLRTVLGARQTELWFHQRFAAARVSGEIFRFDPDMLTVVPPWRRTAPLEQVASAEGYAIAREEADIRHRAEAIARFLLSECGGDLEHAATRIGLNVGQWRGLIAEPVAPLPAFVWGRLLRWKARRDELERAAMLSRDGL